MSPVPKTTIRIPHRNPTPEPVDTPNDLGEVSWPAFTWDEQNIFYVSNTSISVIQDWRQRDYAFWREYLDYVTGDAPIPLSGNGG